MHLELAGRGGLKRPGVGDVERQLDILHGLVLVAVVDGQRATEGLAGHRHGLIDLQRDGGADAVALVIGILLEFDRLGNPHLVSVLIAHGARCLLGLLNQVEILLDVLIMDAILRLGTSLFEGGRVVQTLHELGQLGLADALRLDGQELVDRDGALMSGSSLQHGEDFLVGGLLNPSGVAENLQFIGIESPYLLSRNLSSQTIAGQPAGLGSRSSTTRREGRAFPREGYEGLPPGMLIVTRFGETDQTVDDVDAGTHSTAGHGRHDATTERCGQCKHGTLSTELSHTADSRQATCGIVAPVVVSTLVSIAGIRAIDASRLGNEGNAALGPLLQIGIGARVAVLVDRDTATV